jgi:hypothetical protein
VRPATRWVSREERRNGPGGSLRRGTGGRQAGARAVGQRAWEDEECWQLAQRRRGSSSEGEGEDGGRESGSVVELVVVRTTRRRARVEERGQCPPALAVLGPNGLGCRTRSNKACEAPGEDPVERHSGGRYPWAHAAQMAEQARPGRCRRCSLFIIARRGE